MEDKLRSMEQRLQQGATAVASLPPRGDQPTGSEDGGVAFRFGGTPLPSSTSADRGKQVAVNGSTRGPQ